VIEFEMVVRMGSRRPARKLHVASESAAGGPLGLVRTGDLISLDIRKRQINVDLTDGGLDERRR
jgi:dihydroxyacid dehydratase/phosphogluconate dehydratase